MTETTSEERRITVRPSMALAHRNRPRGLWGQITTSLLRPGLFYRTLLPASETRQWLWAGILVLALVGIAAVRYSSLANAPAQDPGAVIDPGFPPMDDFGGDFGSDFGGMGPDFGGMPPGGAPGDGGGAPTAESTLTDDLTTALLAASNLVLGWIVLTIMLIVVPMLRGRAPKPGQNLQIAVWSSLPLALMAVVQLIYWSGGGRIGEPGVQGLLSDWPEFTTLDPTVQAVLISLTSRLTIFWLWSLMLVYFGARFALGGWRIVAFVLVLAWALVQIGAPVVTGAITADTLDETEVIDPGIEGDFPPDMGGEFPGSEMPMDGEMPPDMGGEMPEMDPGMVAPEVEATEEVGESAAPADTGERPAPPNRR